MTQDIEKVEGYKYGNTIFYTEEAAIAAKEGKKLRNIRDYYMMHNVGNSKNVDDLIEDVKINARFYKEVLEYV